MYRQRSVLDRTTSCADPRNFQPNIHPRSQVIEHLAPEPCIPTLDAGMKPLSELGSGRCTAEPAGLFAEALVGAGSARSSTRDIIAWRGHPAERAPKGSKRSVVQEKPQPRMMEQRAVSESTPNLELCLEWFMKIICSDASVSSCP